MLRLRGLPVVQHPLDVVLRARCLAASALVAIAPDEPELRAKADALVRGAQGALTPRERRALEGDALDAAERALLSWQTVGAAVLVWALGRTSAPPGEDRAPDTRQIVDGLLLVPAVAPADRLRPIADLRRLARRAHAAAARARAEQLARLGGALPTSDLDDGRLEEVAAIGRERHHAARWLLSDSPAWPH
jgi:hypothetical protein